MHRKLLCLIPCLCCLWAPPASAAGEEHATAQVDRAQVNLGDALVYTVEVSTAGENQASPDILLPDFSQQFQVQDVFSRSSINILNGKTFIVNFKEAHLIANHKGEIVIPPSRVELISSRTRERVTLETQPVTVRVNEASGAAARPTPTPEIDVLRPIKRSAHLSLSQWLPFACGLALIAGVIGYGWMREHRQAPPPPPPVVEDRRTPEERALEALAALEAAEPLRQAGRHNEFYTLLSAVLRRYLEEKYAFPAEELTTPEILREMERLRFHPEFSGEVARFFRECDQVKFANVTPPGEAVGTALQRARELVQEPDKRDEPEPTAAEPGAEAGGPPGAEGGDASAGKETAAPLAGGGDAGAHS